MQSTSSTAPVIPAVRTSRQNDFDWREYYYAIKARSWIILFFTILSIFWGIYSASTLREKYIARSVLFIQQVKSNILSVKIEEVSDEQIKSIDMINTLVDLLQSYPFALRVVNSEKLAQDPQFLAAAGLSFGKSSPEASAQALTKMLKTNYRLNTRLIDIFVTTRNPALSIRLANAYPTEYFRYLNDKRVESTRSASSFLMDEAERLRKKMRASEEGMQNFRERERAASFESMLQEAQTHITDLSFRQNQLQAKLSQISSDLEIAKANQGNRQQLLRLPSVASDPKIATEINHLADLDKEFVLIKQRYRNKHPLYISYKTQIDLANQDLNSQLDQIVGLLDSMKTSLLNQQAADKSERDEAEKHLLAVTGKSIEYNDLKRELESDGALYSSVVGRIKEVDVTKELDSSPVQLQEAATGASPFGGAPLIILIKSVLMGISLGIAVVIGLHKLDSSLKTVDQVEQLTGIPVVAAIPQIGEPSKIILGLFSKEQLVLLHKAWKGALGALGDKSIDFPKRLSEVKEAFRPVISMLGNPNVTEPLSQGSELVVKDDRSGVVAEAFRCLRASVAMNAHVENQRTFLLTSAAPSEGKSFCSANFAITLAQQGLSTLLIDADLRKPTVSRLFFGMHIKPGVSECLLGMTPLKYAVQTTQIEGLSVLTAGGRSPNPSELLSGQPFKELLEEALRNYDRVVIDSSPLLAVSDTLLIAPRADVVCLVIRSFMTPRKMVSRALKSLSEVHIKPTGIVFNCLPAASSYSYYYSGKYYGTYGSKGVYGS